METKNEDNGIKFTEEELKLLTQIFHIYKRDFSRKLQERIYLVNTVARKCEKMEEPDALKQFFGIFADGIRESK